MDCGLIQNRQGLVGGGGNTLVQTFKSDPFGHPPSIIRQTPWSCGIYDFRESELPLTHGTDYFNCSLVDIGRKSYLIVRRSRWVKGLPFGMNDLVAFRLRHGITPTEATPIALPREFGDEHFEDPRVFNWNDRLWLSCTNFVWRPEWSGAHQIFCELTKDFKLVKRYDPDVGGNDRSCLTNKTSQKNWIWFFHNGLAHLVYLSQPFTVIEFAPDMTPLREFKTESPRLRWEHGQIRGGTPPVRVGDEYWSFYHSSIDWAPGNVKRYFMGAYAFESNPPFRLTRYTPSPILTGTPSDRWNTGKPYVVFPCGALLRHGHWTVTLGVNDLDCGWIEIPHNELCQLVTSL